MLFYLINSEVMLKSHRELEILLNRLRAGVLGANDGIVSVADVIVGVAAAGNGFNAVIVAGVATGGCGVSLGSD